MRRDPDLQLLLDLTEEAIAARAESGSPVESAAGRVFGRLRALEGAMGYSPSARLPLCSLFGQCLAEAERGPQPVPKLADALADIEPHLNWTRRKGADPANSVFWNGHANAMIVGPGGLEARDDVWIGVSLMAPHLTYVDHDHAPEEVYVALTSGEWWNSDMDWTNPGIGGLIYNRPGVKHTMRSGAFPFLALWCLPVDEGPEVAMPEPERA